MIILPVIIASIASAGLGLVGKAAREVAKDEENKVYELNTEIQNIVNHTKESLEKAGKDLNNANNRLIGCKINVNNNELKTFVNEFQKLHNVEELEKSFEFFNINEEIEKQKARISTEKVDAKYRTECSTASVVAQTLLTPPVVSAGIIVKEFVSYMKSTNKLEVLEATKKDVINKREKALIKIKLMEDASQKCLEAKNVLSRLAANLKETTAKLSEICSAKDYNYKNFTKEEKTTVFMCINLAKAISSIIDIPFVFENGEINAEAVSCLQLCDKELEIKENNNG